MFGRNIRQPKMETWITPRGYYSRMAKDILDSPHTLIAGSTGCGKSTFIHAIMEAFLTLKSPVCGRLILIDPKMVELHRYAVLPHTIRYEETVDGACEALDQAVAVMMERYRTMRATNTTSWNKSQIYIIIDELADLMLSARSVDITKKLQKILQLGRAAGIHVIAATQCPNRKVICTELQCNFTNLVGMRCRSANESRMIVGVKGCELLPLHGQAYYAHGCEIELYNLPYVKTEDIKPLLRYWTSPACRVA